MKNRKQTKSTRKIFWGGVLIVFILAIFVGVAKNNEASLPHSNIVDTKISQYSDKNITQNAIATNPEFKNIAFDPVPAKSYFFSNQIASVIRAVKSLTDFSKKEPIKERGSWLWTPIMSMSDNYIESILSQAKTEGVNVIYISVDTYLDIFTMPKGEERERQKEFYSNRLEHFIIQANKKGIAVDAEAGWRNWAEKDNIYKAFAIVNYVKNFNATRQNKFRGFQYDVEPYLLDNYEKNKVSVLRNFVSLIDETERFIASSPLRFSIAIPDFYDGKDKMTPKFSYDGKKDYAFRHLLNILDRREDSSIILMSYRNFAEGRDGTIDISKNEMQTASKGSYKTRIIIAQETSDVPPPFITFHQTSKEYLEKQIKKINTSFGPYQNFGGISIHYVNAFLALK